MKEAGYPDGTNLPLTLKAKIANASHTKYFVSGVLKKEQGDLIVDVSLYEAKRGKRLTQNRFQGTDIFAIADEISLKLKQDLEIPERHIEEVQDLPVAERVSTSPTAYRKYIAGLNSIIFEQNWPQGITEFESAIAEDTTFALAYFQLHSAYIFANQSEKLDEVMSLLMKHLHKLPERIQLVAKQSYYYNVKQDAEKGLNVLKMWEELYPDDIAAHQSLSQVFLLNNQLSEAIREYEHVLTLDPERFDAVRRIGKLYRQKGDFERSLTYFKRYAEHNPSDPKSFKGLGGLYKTMGDYEQSKINYGKALVFEPEDVSTLLELADIEGRLGNFDEAYEQYQETLKLSKSPKDRHDVYKSLVSFCEGKGQLSKALEYTNLRLSEGEKFQPPALVLMQKLQNLDKHVMAGQIDYALKQLDEIKARIKPPFDKALPLGYLKVYLALDDAENAQEAVAGVGCRGT